MSLPSELPSSPEHLYAEAERTRLLAEELAKLRMKPKPMWAETLATVLVIVALQLLLGHLSLSIADRILIFVGFTAPVAALAARLYKSERRVEMLVQLLVRSGSLKV